MTVTPATAEAVGRIYGPIAEAGHRLLTGYSDADLELLTGFLEADRPGTLRNAVLLPFAG
ncbi:hypothetical protein KZ829_08685 [Actinoplanes hulinensis]|uniref:Uncharacterized protein n=1 Tax=Actinoplanes hulinensis TaxID=1144547 RepID=A0ABS7AYJ7_9ACTN|nr:hypothetical protein [Actinoplanes hulinensis]MBW6433811.1 hypothetical protein [Actinoplanes hulinensis]